MPRCRAARSIRVTLRTRRGCSGGWSCRPRSVDVVLVVLGVASTVLVGMRRVPCGHGSARAAGVRESAGSATALKAAPSQTRRGGPMNARSRHAGRASRASSPAVPAMESTSRLCGGDADEAGSVTCHSRCRNKHFGSFRRLAFDHGKPLTGATARVSAEISEQFPRYGQRGRRMPRYGCPTGDPWVR